MHAFLAVRYVAFALFILFSGLGGSFSALNLGYITSGIVSTKSVVATSLNTYLVALSIFNVLLLLLVIAIELCRKGAITSQIWFELIWVAVFCLAYLAGSISVTLFLPGEICRRDMVSRMACMASTVLIVFTWIEFTLYLFYFILLLVYSLRRSVADFVALNNAVVDQTTRPQAMDPMRITHSYPRSVDGAFSDVHQVSFKGTESTDGDSIVEFEKKMYNGSIRQPVFTMDPSNGPPILGTASRFERKGVKDSINIGSIDMIRRDMGTEVVNQAPAHHSLRTVGDIDSHQLQQHPYRGQVDVPETASSTSGGNVSHYTRKQAAWLNDQETPSPAAIMHASNVIAAPPSVSFYPVHAVSTGPATQPAQSQTSAAARALTGVLQDKSQNQIKTSLAYLVSSRTTLERSAALSSPSQTNSMGHSYSHSIDSFVQTNSSSTANLVRAPSHRATKSAGQIGPQPKRIRNRPPPLNLSSLSNIASAERRS